MTEFEQGTETPFSFDAMLQELRAEGCAVLVANDKHVEASRAAARLVLGRPGEQRYRVLAFDEDPTAGKVAGFLPGELTADAETVTVVSNGSPTRSAAEPAAGTSLGPDGTGLGDDELRRFAGRVCRTLAAAGERFQPLDPAALRVAAFDLSTLAARHSHREVRRFCRIVGAHVRGLRGMAYFFVGDSMQDPVVESLRPVCDARIDVRRQAEDGFEQRWHVHEYEFTTQWVALEPPA